MKPQEGEYCIEFKISCVSGEVFQATMFVNGEPVTLPFLRGGWQRELRLPTHQMLDFLVILRGRQSSKACFTICHHGKRLLRVDIELNRRQYAILRQDNFSLLLPN